MAETSLDFHSAIESPGAYLRRERFTIAIWLAIFTAVVLAAIFSVDPAYYYPRLITDQLLYYMKGLALVQHGTTEARAAVNLEPFNYAAGPGLLRVPWLILFRDFDQQLRAIQLSNMALASVLAVQSAYIVSWVLPKAAHSAAVAFSFLTLLMNPTWISNVFSPLADLPYAVLTLAAVIVITRVFCGTPEERRSAGPKILFLILLLSAFAVRFTAPVLLVYARLLRGRGSPGSGHRIQRAEITAVVAGLVLLVIVNFRAIVFYYLSRPFGYFVRADLKGMLLNAAVLGIPSQLIPGYELLFRRFPVQYPYHPVFATNPFDLALVIAGIGVTAVTVLGMWKARRYLRPELAYVIVPFPVLAALIPSTPRYLLSYQPLFWMFMYAGSTAVLSGLAPSVVLRRWLKPGAALLLCLLVGFALYTRSFPLSGGAVTTSGFSLGATRGHASDVARTYRSLRNFLEGLPRNRSLVISDPPSTGQWKVIAGIDHYWLDTTLPSVMRQHDLYLIIACAVKSECAEFEGWDMAARATVLRYADVRFDRVFQTGTPYALARVYRLYPVQ